MGIFFFFVFVTLAAPILFICLVAYVIMFLRSLSSGERPIASRVFGAGVSGLLFEFQILCVLLVAVIILVPRNSGSFMYGGMTALLVLTGLLGICGTVYFLIRGAPWWCQWGRWWQLIAQPRAKE